jgi:hypothetical protein
MRGEPCEILHSVSRERSVNVLIAETRNRFGKGVDGKQLLLAEGEGLHNRLEDVSIILIEF